MILFQFALKDRVVSSACISMVKLFKCQGISFTNKRNKTGPRIDPSGTSCLTGFGSDILCPSFTNCHRSSRYDRNQATLSGLATFSDNFTFTRDNVMVKLIVWDNLLVFNLGMETRTTFLCLILMPLHWGIHFGRT